MDYSLIRAVEESDVATLLRVVKCAGEIEPYTVSLAEEIAEEKGNLRVIRIMKKIQEKQISSKLSSAVTSGDYLGVEPALSAGADPNIVIPWKFNDRWGGQNKSVPLLTVAVHLGTDNVVDALLKGNPNVEARGDFWQAPLALAASNGRTTMVEKLLEHGANSNATDLRGATPVHAAATYGHVSIIQKLRAQDGRLDSVSNNGSTPLHSAAYDGRRPMVEWLLQAGVNVAPVNNSGDTAADQAESRGHKDLADLLRSNKHKSGQHHNSSQQSPVHTSVSSTVSTLKSLKLISNIQVKQSKKVYIMNFINFTGKVRIQSGSKTEEKKLGVREGAIKDSENLQETFSKLGYQVIIKQDMTASETNAFLDGIQKDLSLDFLLLFVLSHGVDDEVFCTSDGVQFSMEEVKYKFTDTNCPQLKGLSKIILSNFCRGQNIEKLANDAVIARDEVPHKMITIYSSYEEFISKRSSLRGTIFVYDLCEVLNNDPTLPIQDVFNEVYDKMAKVGQTPEMKVSAPFANFTF